MWLLLLVANTACLASQIYFHNWPFVAVAGVGTALSLIGVSREL